MIRYIFNLALRWEIPGIKANPCAGVPLLEFKDKKERYLSQEEAKRLYDAVCQSDNTMLEYIVPMLILTGVRKLELFYAKWEDFDLQRRIWRNATIRVNPLSLSTVPGIAQERRQVWRTCACMIYGIALQVS